MFRYQTCSHTWLILPVVQDPKCQLILKTLVRDIENIFIIWIPLHCKSSITNPDAVPGKEGAIQPGLATHPCQYLAGLDWVPPLIVPTWVILGCQTTCGPVAAVEPVLQVNLGLTNQVIRAKEVPVKNLNVQ